MYEYCSKYSFSKLIYKLVFILFFLSILMSLSSYCYSFYVFILHSTTWVL